MGKYPRLSTDSNLTMGVSFLCMARSIKVNPGDEKSQSNRLVINLTPDNQIDWSAVRGSTEEQLLHIVNNDVKILEHIGMSHESGENNEGGDSDFEGDITAANVAAFLDGLTKTNAMAVSMLIPKFMSHPFFRTRDGKKVPFQIDRALALQKFSLTEAQHAELDPRAERLAKKYMPAVAKKHLDVIMLASMYFTYMTQNLQATISAQLQADMKQAVSGPSAAPPQAPIESDARQPTNGHAVEPLPDEEFTESFEPGTEPDQPTV